MLPPFFSRPPSIPKLLKWRLRPLWRLGHETYGWNLIDPRGFVRASFLASLNEVADVARQEMKGMRS